MLIVRKDCEVSQAITKMNFCKLKFQIIFLRNASRIPDMKYSRNIPSRQEIGRQETFCPENNFFEILMILFETFYLGKVIDCTKIQRLDIFYLELFT